MDQASTLREMAKENGSTPSLKKEKRTKVIAITSGKGGVGKTNVVANLALSLSMLGKKVVIFDADLGLANIDVLLGLIPRYDIQHVLQGEKRLDEVMLNGPEGIKIIPASSGIQELTEMNEEQKMRLLSEFDILDKDVDILLIDTAAGISSNVMYFNIAAQEIIVIVSGEPTSITDAYAMMKVMSLKYGEKHFRLIVNSVRDENEGKEVFHKLSTVADKFLDVSIDYLGFIPFDEKMLTAVKQQKALVDIFPHTAGSRAFRRLAKEISRMNPKTNPKGNIQFFWNRILQEQMRS